MCVYVCVCASLSVCKVSHAFIGDTPCTNEALLQQSVCLLLFDCVLSVIVGSVLFYLCFGLHFPFVVYQFQGI